MEDRRPHPNDCAFVYSPDYFCDIGAHVFPTVKFERVHALLRRDGDIPSDRFLTPQPASREDLELVHTRAYLDDLSALRRTPGTTRSELPLTEQIVRAYALAAGGTLLAARRALQHGLAANLGGGFHHAFAGHAEGFCYINDVAVAIRRLLADKAIRRAAVVDLDVHQGNGTAAIFATDPAVYTFSMHQEKNYPAKQRSTLDVGLDDGVEDGEYLDLLNTHLPAILDGFGPDLVLYVAGVDVYREDVLGGLALTLDGIRERDLCVVGHCVRRGIPLAATLAGGYAARLDDTLAAHHTLCRILWDTANGEE